MKIFDFNIHLPKKIDIDNTKETILDEQSSSFEDLKKSFENYVMPNKEFLYGSNIMIFNENLFKKDFSKTFFQYIYKNFKNTFFTTLVDFRDKHYLDYLEFAHSKGVKGLKFHSYVQNISNNDIDNIIKLCKKAEQLHMFIAIDTSYGTLDLYTNDNLKLAAHIANNIKKTPIVLLHSGGARVFEAMLIASAQNNIFLETSFSIEYYKQSSIEKDFAFAYKKLSSKKIIYGSDAPYIDLRYSIDSTLEYLQKNNFSAQNIEDIMGLNAINILDNL